MQGRTRTEVLQRRGQSDLNPQALMDLMTLFIVSVAAGSMFIAPQGLMLPVFATAMMATGAALGLFAWCRRMPQQRSLSVWDVAGSLLALGFCAAIFADNASIATLISL